MIDSMLSDLTRLLIRQALVAAFSGGGGGSASTPDTSAMTSALSAGALAGAVGAFATGGSFNVGGTGGTDSQVVAFRASPGEHVAVTRPGDHGYGGGNQGQPPTLVVRNINVSDPSKTVNDLDSRDGERLILNTVSKNPKTISHITKRNR